MYSNQAFGFDFLETKQLYVRVRDGEPQQEHRQRLGR